VIIRAYYGLVTDIKKYLDTTPELAYWDDFAHRCDENLENLLMVNVTIPTRFKLDDKLGCLKIGSSSK
jgi:hypothetical protein